MAGTLRVLCRQVRADDPDDDPISVGQAAAFAAASPRVVRATRAEASNPLRADGLVVET